MPEQVLCNSKIQNCVPEKFKTLIGNDPFIAGDLKIRAVGQGFGEQLLVMDRVVENLLEFSEINVTGVRFSLKQFDKRLDPPQKTGS